jgi:glycosyltransferase involved in cell wall biosynthesis
MADDRSDLGEAAKNGWAGRIVAHLGRTAFTRWVATTQAVRDALMRAGVPGSRIDVIPNGIVLPEHPAPRREQVRRFLYLGRLSTNIQRDVPGLIRAFDTLANEFADVELAIVGGGDLLEETRGIAAGCRHADRIQVPGQGDADQWLAWADAFVLPSRREGLSNALLEAMACGLPCIANDIPPNREVLGSDGPGLLVAVGDTRALEEGMLLLVGSPELAARLSNVAQRRIAAKYSLSHVCSDYKCLYSSLRREP